MPIGYILFPMLISILSVSVFTLNIALGGISVFPFKIVSISGLILGSRHGSSYRYNTMEAGSRYKYN